MTDRELVSSERTLVLSQPGQRTSPLSKSLFRRRRRLRLPQSKMSAPSMAAALAASLPAPTANPAPAGPVYEAIPPSMSTAIDVEAEIPLTCVQLDALVRLWDHTAFCL